MAKNVLPVDFQDDILTEDMDGRRKYQMITNADGTVSFVDVTEYTQVGSNFGQAQINATNEAVNESADKNKIIDSKADLMANTQSGMIAGASAVKAAVSELNEKSIKADVLEITTNEFSNVNLSNYGYTVENTIAVYVVGGLSGYNAHARLYTYNGLLYALITDSGSNNGFKNTKVELKMLHI